MYTNLIVLYSKYEQAWGKIVWVEIHQLKNYFDINKAKSVSSFLFLFLMSNK